MPDHLPFAPPPGPDPGAPGRGNAALSRAGCGTPKQFFKALLGCALLGLSVALAILLYDPLGTFHRARAEARPQLLVPAPLPTGGWRVCWSSTVGHTYQLLRSSADVLGATNWIAIATLTATDVSACYDDSATSQQRFYRVLDVGSAAQTFTLGDPDHFLALGTNGQGVLGLLPSTNAAGALTPFEFRPSGASANGLVLRFSDGAQTTSSLGQTFLRFTKAQALFPPDSPIQFAPPLVRTGSAPALVPVSGLEVGQLAAIFGLNPTDGIPVLVYGRLPLRLTAGVFNDDGLQRAGFGLNDLHLALPFASGEYVNFSVDLSDRGALRIPLYGQFSLPDGSPTPLSLKVSPDRPLWLQLNPNGDVALGGRADAEFTGGPKLTVDFNFDDPHYDLQFAASGLHLPLLGSLADLLPTPPVVPASTDVLVLNSARDQLVCFDKAVSTFCAAAAGVVPAGQDNTASTPPGLIPTATSVLDAWGFASACSSNGLSASTLRGALQHAGDQATASRELDGMCCQEVALLRLRSAYVAGGLTSDPQALAELDTALTNITIAVIARAQKPGAIQSLSKVRDVLDCLLRVETLRQQLGLSDDPNLVPALEQLFSDFYNDYTATLGVQPGVFTPPAGSPVLSMSRFTALDHVRDLVQAESLQQLLGLTNQITAPVEEAMAQLAVSTWLQVSNALASAEANTDYLAFTYALEDALELVGLVQSGVFPSGQATGLPGAADLGAFPSRLNAVFLADYNRPAGQRSLNNQKQQLGRLVRILRQLPPGFSYTPAPIQRAFDRLDTALNSAMLALGTLSLPDVKAVLEAGIVQSELRDRFGLTPTVSWETARLPLVLARLETLTQQQNAWSDIHDSMTVLLAEAERQSTNGTPQQRQLYLSKTAELAVTQRAAAGTFWQNAQTLRSANPALVAADLMLPGDIYVDKVAGAIRYARDTKLIEGAFSGKLRLPKFDLSLNVQNASFSSGGAFDVSVSGQIALGTANSQVGQLAVSDRRPLHLTYHAPRDLRFEGAGRLQLNNGMAFDAQVTLADPVYAFGLTAEGIRFSLATNLTVRIPTLPNTGPFTTEAAGTLNDYFHSLGATFERLTPLADPVRLGEPGEPPDYQTPSVTLQFDEVDALANSVLANIELGISADFQTVSNDYRNAMVALAGSLRQERSQLSANEWALRRLVLERTAEAVRRLSAINATQANNLVFMPETQAAVAETGAEMNALLDSPDGTKPELQIATLTKVLKFNQAAQELNADSTSTMSKVSDYMTRARAANYARLGIDPATGAAVPPPTGNLDLFFMDELYAEWLNQFRFEQLAQQIEANPAPVTRVATQTLAMRYRELALKRLSELRTDNLEDFAEIAHVTARLSTLYTANQAGLLDYPSYPIPQPNRPPAVVDANTDFFENLRYYQNQAGAWLISNAQPVSQDYANQQLAFMLKHHHTDFFDRVGVMQELAAKVPETLDPVLASVRMTGIRSRIVLLESEISAQWSANRIHDGVKLLDELIVLVDEAGTLGMPEFATLRDVDLPNLTVKFYGAAEAQKAWWLLTRYNDLLLSAISNRISLANSTLPAAFTAAASDSIRSCARIVNALPSLIPPLAPVDLPLPGDVYVRRVFGSVLYNRQTGYLQGSFGGRLEFPDLQNAFFEITNATVDSNLRFSIGADTTGPLPFGRATLSAAVNASGGYQQPLNFAGSGSLSFSNGPAVAVGLAWQGGPHILSIATAVTNLQTFRFTDDLVLFNANLGMDIRPDAQSGDLKVGGSAGLFATAPLPTNAPPARTNFYLFVQNAQASLVYQPGQTGIILSNGTLFLPAVFQPTNMSVLCSNGTATGPSISLNAANPVQANFYDGNPPDLQFSGELLFKQFGVAVPGLPGLEAAVCSATLKFSNRNLPVLTNLNATLQIPLPNQTNFVDVQNGVFTLNGYPSGRIQLRSDLTLSSPGGVRFVLLGQGHTNCPGGSGLTVYPSAGFQTPPAFKLDGGIQMVAPLNMLTDTNGQQVTATACGSLSVTNGGLPELDLNLLQLGGTFRLGNGGPLIQNASLALVNLQNLFQLAPNRPFLLQLSGALQIPNGPGFMLQNAVFSFTDPNQLPGFTLGGLGFDASNFKLMNYLPAQIKRAQFHFLNPNAPLPELLYPTNVSLVLSAAINLPNANQPYLIGAVENIVVDFLTNGVPVIKGVDAIDMGVGGLKLPPIRELGGRLRVGGLSQNDPSAVYLVGRLGGSYQGYTVIGQAAFNLSGPIGFCIDVNAGAAGIPVGPTGILITGASGGESFVNNNGDPCNFKTYFTTNAAGDIVAPSAPLPPGTGMSWDDLRQVADRMEQELSVFTNAVSGLANPGIVKKLTTSTANLPCPGDCPPPTVDIFCQPHPDQSRFPGKTIAKFTSLDEATLNGLGITPAFVQTLGTDAAAVAASIAHIVRTNVEALTPMPDPALLGPASAGALEGIITNGLNSVESGFSNLCWQALASTNATGHFYETIRDQGYAGLPCMDVTLAVSGNVSYAGISSFAYVSGKGVLSTAGAAGVIGTVYVVGIPLGEGKVFVAATDAQGNPNPSLCGQVEVSYGPLDIGNVKVSYACPGCVTGVLQGFPVMIAALSDAVLYQIAGKVAPELHPESLTRSQLLSALASLGTQQKLGIFAELANQPLANLPPNLPQVFFQGIANEYDAINPVLSACGVVQPKIFGLPLGSEAVGVKMFETKEEFAGSLQFAPSLLLSYFVPMLPPGDAASLSFSTAISDPYKFLFGGLAGGLSPDNAAAYIQSSIDYMLENTSFAVDYELNPLGLKTASAAARVILPDLTTHPVLPWSTWVRPEDRGNTNLPSRHDLLIDAVVAGKLGGAVNWRGTTNDLASIYAAGSPQALALAGLSLQKDYFPHGGVVGAARLTLPAIITDKAPLNKINTVVDANANPFDRLSAAIDVFQNYILRMNTNGTIAFYVPAPNPPAFYDTNGLLLGQAQLQALAANLSPQAVLDSIKSFDIQNLRRGNFYPLEQAFIQGYLDGQLLGVPILRADVLGLPADAQRSEGFLSITANIPAGSWLQQFVPQASLVFDMRGIPPQPIERRFGAVLVALQAAHDTNADNVTVQRVLQDAVAALTGEMPKTSLTADLQIGLGLAMPTPLSDLIVFDGDAHLHAFSPRYQPDYQTNDTGPLATVQREGGIAFDGAMRLRANGADIASIPTAQFSLVPKDSGLPQINGQFSAPVISLPGLTLNNWSVQFASDPSPSISAAGSLSGPVIGMFGIQPLNGTTLSGQLNVASTSLGHANVNLALGPAKLVLPSVFQDQVLIFGADMSKPFTLSTTGPWAASVGFTSGLTLGAGGINLVSFNWGSGLGPVTFTGSGLNVGSFSTSFNNATTLTVFPGNPTLQRSLTLSSGVSGSLSVSNDASFSVLVMLGSPLVFNGISVPAGAQVQIANSGVSFTWQVSGATASLTITPAGGINFNGGANLPPLNFGIFQITGTDGGNLTGTFNNDGFAVSSGAKLTLLADWLQNQSVTLSAFTYSNNGALSVTVTNPSNMLVFSGYPFDLTGFSFTRLATNFGGTATFRVSGTLHSVPTFAGWPNVPFTGVIASDGSVALASTAANTALFGFPVQGFTNSFTLSAGQYAGRLSSQFQLGNGAGLWSVLGSNWFTGTLNVDGSARFLAIGSSAQFNGFGLANTIFSWNQNGPGSAPVVHLEGDLLMSGFAPLRLAGNFSGSSAIQLVPVPPALPTFPYSPLDAQLSLALSASGLSVTGLLHQAPLPAIGLSGSVSTSGAYHLSGQFTGTVDGYGVTNLSLALDGSGSAGSLSATGALVIPNLGAYVVSGGFTNGAGYRLGVSLPAGLNLNNLPVQGIGLSGGALLSWTPAGADVAGTFSGGVLGTVGVIGSASGDVAFAPTGSASLSAVVTIQAFTNGQFRIHPAAGVNFSASLDNFGLELPAGALFEYGTNFSAGLPLPQITIAADGSFTAVAGVPAPLSLQLLGFSLQNTTFILRRAAGATLSVPSFGGLLAVPLLNVAGSVNGALTNDSTFSLSGTIGSSLSLSGLGLPVSALNAGANVTLNNSGLSVGGGLNGAIFSSLPGASIAGTLAITAPPSASVSLGGVVTVPSLALGSFGIRRSDNAAISALWNNSGVIFPSTQNLELDYRGARLGTFTLPSFTISSSGDFAFAANGVAFSLDGFNLTAANLTFSRASGVSSLNVGTASLSVPNLGTALTVTLSGSIRSDGTYGIVGSTGLNPVFPSGLPVTQLAANSTVTLAGGGVTLTGNLTGGCLSALPVGPLTVVNGTLTVSASGAAVVAGGVSVAPLSFGSFTLSSAAGGNFSASLTTGGLSFPAGSLLSYNGVSLGQFSLPTFTVPASGNFQVAAPPGDFDLAGFDFNNASFVFARSGSFAAVSNFSGSINIPGLNTSVSLTGAITNNNSYRFTGTLATTISPAGLPASLNAGATTVLSSSGGLTLSGTLSGRVLNTVPLPVGSVTGLVSVSPNGTLNLSGSVSVNRIVYGALAIESSTGGNMVAQWRLDGLRFSGVRVNAGTVLNSTFTLPDFTIETDGSCKVALPATSPAGLRLLNYPIANLSFTLLRSSSTLSLNPLSAQLNIGEFNQSLLGSITTGIADATATVAGDYNGSLTLAGFTAANGFVSMRNSGVTGGGNFNLTAAGHTFNSGLYFSGTVGTGGAYAWTGNDTLNFGGVTTALSTFTLDGSGVSGYTSRSYGSPTVSGKVALNSSGISYNLGASGDSGWHWTGTFGIYTRMIWNLSASNSDAQGDATGNASGTLYGWDENTQGTSLPDVGSVPSCETLGASGSVGTDGVFRASMNACGFYSFPGFSNFGLNLWL